MKIKLIEINFILTSALFQSLFDLEIAIEKVSYNYL